MTKTQRKVKLTFDHVSKLSKATLFYSGAYLIKTEEYIPPIRTAPVFNIRSLVLSRPRINVEYNHMTFLYSIATSFDEKIHGYRYRRCQ